jgi:hypothetical protein
MFSVIKLVFFLQTCSQSLITRSKSTYDNWYPCVYVMSHIFIFCGYCIKVPQTEWLDPKLKVKRPSRRCSFQSLWERNCSLSLPVLEAASIP